MFYVSLIVRHSLDPSTLIEKRLKKTFAETDRKIPCVCQLLQFWHAHGICVFYDRISISCIYSLEAFKWKCEIWHKMKYIFSCFEKTHKSHLTCLWKASLLSCSASGSTAYSMCCVCGAGDYGVCCTIREPTITVSSSKRKRLLTSLLLLNNKHRNLTSFAHRSESFFLQKANSSIITLHLI